MNFVCFVVESKVVYSEAEVVCFKEADLGGEAGRGKNSADGPADLRLTSDCTPQVRLRVRPSKNRLGTNSRAKGPIHTSLGQRPRKEGLCFLIRAESPLH